MVAQILNTNYKCLNYGAQGARMIQYQNFQYDYTIPLQGLPSEDHIINK